MQAVEAAVANKFCVEDDLLGVERSYGLGNIGEPVAPIDPIAGIDADAAHISDDL
jgi:hypothetical protein